MGYFNGKESIDEFWKAAPEFVHMLILCSIGQRAQPTVSEFGHLSGGRFSFNRFACLARTSAHLSAFSIILAMAGRYSQFVNEKRNRGKFCSRKRNKRWFSEVLIRLGYASETNNHSFFTIAFAFPSFF